MRAKEGIEDFQDLEGHWDHQVLLGSEVFQAHLAKMDLLESLGTKGSQAEKAPLAWLVVLAKLDLEEDLVVKVVEEILE